MATLGQLLLTWIGAPTLSEGHVLGNGTDARSHSIMAKTTGQLAYLGIFRVSIHFRLLFSRISIDMDYFVLTCR
jgi:hypothetical protein